MEKQYEDNEIEIDLKEIFFLLLYQWKMILLVAVLVGGIVFSYCRFFVTPMYDSTSKLYVLSKSTSVTSLADIHSGESLTSDYLLVVGGRYVVDTVIANLELDENYESFCTHLEVTNPNDTRLIYITYTDADAVLAKTIVDELASVASSYIADKMDQDAPTIIEYGYSDGDKVSPTTAKNVVIGALLGVIVAVAVIILTSN